MIGSLALGALARTDMDFAPADIGTDEESA